MPKDRTNKHKQGQNGSLVAPITEKAEEPEFDPYESLGDAEKLAVDMRLLNLKYGDIAAKINRSERTVEAWFAPNGRYNKCYSAFKFISAIRDRDREERKKANEKAIQDASHDAVLTLTTIARGGPHIGAVARVMASKIILEISGYQPPPPDTTQRDSEAITLLRKLLHENEQFYKRRQSGADVQGKRGTATLDSKTKRNR